MFGRRRVRRLAAATTALTFLLILLGVYTGARGSGLACSAQWPLCDGGVLPKSVPSFLEWLHRFVAMIAGFAILGTAVGFWRSYEADRIRYGGVVALAVLPVQVLLGRLTITKFTAEVQTAHHGAALVIFTALLSSTLWAYEADPAPDPADSTVEDASPTGAPSRSDD